TQQREEQEDRTGDSSTSDGDSDSIWYLLTGIGLVSLLGGWLVYGRRPDEPVPVGNPPSERTIWAYDIKAVHWEAEPSITGDFPAHSRYTALVERYRRPQSLNLNPL